MARTVMIVDDSPSLRTVVRVALTEAKFEVIEATDGLDALEKAAQSPVKLIICDVNMPRMDGLTFVKKLKEQPTLRFMPVVMLTTETKPELVEQGRVVGARAWMVKPIKSDQLLTVVRQFLGP